MPTDLSTRIKNIQTKIGVAATGVIDLATCLKLESLLSITVAGNGLTTHIKAVQKAVGAASDGFVGPETVTKIEGFIAAKLPAVPSGASLVISLASLDLIVSFEVTSKQNYENKLQRPTWPGEASGVTIGIGYDLGYNSKPDITTAWGALVTDANLQLLLSVAGLKGATAKSALAGVKSVIIPFTQAMQVFHFTTLPVFAKKLRKIYPGVEKLPPDAQGALLSLVFNRGESIDPNSDRRKEMFNIVALVAAGDLQGIAAQIRSMKRLWPNTPGLRRRREAEAVMVENASFNILPANQITV